MKSVTSPAARNYSYDAKTIGCSTQFTWLLGADAGAKAVLLKARIGTEDGDGGSVGQAARPRRARSTPLIPAIASMTKPCSRKVRSQLLTGEESQVRSIEDTPVRVAPFLR